MDRSRHPAYAEFDHPWLLFASASREVARGFAVYEAKDVNFSTLGAFPTIRGEKCGLKNRSNKLIRLRGAGLFSRRLLFP